MKPTRLWHVVRDNGTRVTSKPLTYKMARYIKGTLRNMDTGYKYKLEVAS